MVAGALSLEDGARITAVRSKLVGRLAGGGGMAVVELPVDAVEELLKRDGLALSIAVVNTPTSTVVSGDGEAIDAVRRPAHRRGGVLPSGGSGLRVAQCAHGQHPAGS